MEDNHQLTITEYMDYKESLQRELNNMVNGFIRTGYYLKKIRDTEAYRNDGYNSIYEFAEREFGVTRTVASRFMSINDKFSENGHSLELREHYKGLGSSRLSEMLTLPEEDHAMITSVTKIEDIRELKRYEKEKPEQGKELTDTGKSELYRAFFEDAEEQLKAAMLGEDVRDIAEKINPSGNKVFRYKMYFVMFHEYDKGIDVKHYLNGMEHMEWEEFVEQVKSEFVYDPMAAGTVYEQNYGKREPQREEKKEIVEKSKTENGKSAKMRESLQPKEIDKKEENTVSEKEPKIKGSEPVKESEKEAELCVNDVIEEKEVVQEVTNEVCEVAQTRINPEWEGDSHIVHLTIEEYQAIFDGKKKFIICTNNVETGTIMTVRVKFNRVFSDIRAKVTYKEQSNGLMPEYYAYEIEVEDETE